MVHGARLGAVLAFALVAPVVPQTCTDLCNGVCTSPCCTQFALFQAFCQDDIRNHLLTPWSDCSETCLDRMEAMFIETQPGVSCHPIWSNTLTVGTEYVTEEFPHGQHALYEEFLGKCQGQRRRRHMHEHVTQNAIYHTAGDDYVVDPESEIVLNARHPDAPVAIGKVDPQFGLKLDVAGETKARGAELLSLNGWNSTKLSQAKNLGAPPSPAPAAFSGFARRRDRELICASHAATYLCGCDMDTVWFEAERGRVVDPWLLDCGCSVSGTEYCTRDGKCECMKDEEGAYTRQGVQCEQWVTSGLHASAGGR